MSLSDKLYLHHNRTNTKIDNPETLRQSVMKRIKHIITGWLMITGLVFGQTGEVTNVGTTAASFLEIGVGARAIGMGGAFVATANDASAMYWNPAGLGFLSRPEMMFVHVDWLADIDFDFAGAMFPLGQFGTLGASLTSLNMGEMLVRTVDQPDGTGEFFQAGDLALQLSYALPLNQQFSVGMNVKYIYQKIWKETANGFAVDIGTLYKTGYNGLRIGASLTNFGTDMKLSGEDLLVYHDIDPNIQGNNDRVFATLETRSWPLPLNFQAGIAMEVMQQENHRITVATEAMHPKNNTESVHAGFEYAFRELFFLRGGYRNLFLKDSEEGLTLGAGFSTRFLNNLRTTLDYAYADFGRLENVHRFAFLIQF